MTLTIPRKQYVELYGPSAGDRVRLGDTELFIEVERDLLTHGEELVFGSVVRARWWASAAINIASNV